MNKSKFYLFCFVFLVQSTSAQQNTVQSGWGNAPKTGSTNTTTTGTPPPNTSSSSAAGSRDCNGVGAGSVSCFGKAAQDGQNTADDMWKKGLNNDQQGQQKKDSGTGQLTMGAGMMGSALAMWAAGKGLQASGEGIKASATAAYPGMVGGMIASFCMIVPPGVQVNPPLCMACKAVASPAQCVPGCQMPDPNQPPGDVVMDNGTVPSPPLPPGMNMQCPACATYSGACASGDTQIKIGQKMRGAAGALATAGLGTMASGATSTGAGNAQQSQGKAEQAQGNNANQSGNKNNIAGDMRYGTDPTLSDANRNGLNIQANKDDSNGDGNVDVNENKGAINATVPPAGGYLDKYGIFDSSVQAGIDQAKQNGFTYGATSVEIAGNNLPAPNTPDFEKTLNASASDFNNALASAQTAGVDLTKFGLDQATIQQTEASLKGGMELARGGAEAAAAFGKSDGALAGSGLGNAGGGNQLSMKEGDGTGTHVNGPGSGVGGGAGWGGLGGYAGADGAGYASMELAALSGIDMSVLGGRGAGSGATTVLGAEAKGWTGAEMTDRRVNALDLEGQLEQARGFMVPELFRIVSGRYSSRKK